MSIAVGKKRCKIQGGKNREGGKGEIERGRRERGRDMEWKIERKRRRKRREVRRR